MAIKDYFVKREPVGHISGCNGIDIYGIENENGTDFIYYKSNCWGGPAADRYKMHRTKLNKNASGEEYFICSGYRFYLKDSIL